MRTTRRLVLVVLTAAALAVGPAFDSVRAEGAPLRSGTITGGSGLETDGGDPWEQPAAERWGCEYAVDCLGWLNSGCSPALAGHDPVLTASIVDVEDLADGRTSRAFHTVAPQIPPWGLWPGVAVQFWRQDCTEIQEAKVQTIGSESECSWDGVSRCQFRIPAEATWMTVSGHLSTVRLSWTLN